MGILQAYNSLRSRLALGLGTNCDVRVYKLCHLRESRQRCIVVCLQIYPLWRAFSIIFVYRLEIVYIVYVWTGGLNAQKIYTFTNVNVYVWTGPETLSPI